MLDHAVAEQFLRAPFRELVMADTDADSLLQRLDSFVPVRIEKNVNANGNFL